MLPGAKLKYDQKYLKKGVKVMGLGQCGKKIKFVVWCLSWQHIKAVDSLNHLKLFKIVFKKYVIDEKGLF